MEKAKARAIALTRTLVAVGIASGAAAVIRRRTAILAAADAATVKAGAQTIEIANTAVQNADFGWEANPFKGKIVNGIDQTIQNVVAELQTRIPQWFDAALASARSYAEKLAP